MTTQAMECFSEELLNTADKAIFGFNTMGLNELLQEVKAMADQPVAVGILRATAHSAKQAHGERFPLFAAKVCGLTSDSQVGDQICSTAGCRGVNYTPEVIKNILLLGIYDQDVRREVLGDRAIEDKSVNELVRFVEAKEAARDAALRGRPATATAAATSYKRSSRQDNNNQQQQQQRGCPPNNARPKKLCRQDFFNFAARPNGSINQTPYETCRDCFLKQKKDRREKIGRRSNVAAAAMGGQGFDPPSTESSPKREARISFAHTNAKLCGQATRIANHPRLEVKMMFGTPSRRKELRFKDAVADKSKSKSKVDLRAANNTKMDVQGVVDAAISGLSPSGVRFKTTSKVYIVQNVDEVYLSFDVPLDRQQVLSGGRRRKSTWSKDWRMGPHRNGRRATPTRIIQHKGQRQWSNFETNMPTLAQIQSTRQPRPLASNAPNRLRQRALLPQRLQTGQITCQSPQMTPKDRRLFHLHARTTRKLTCSRRHCNEEDPPNAEATKRAQ